MTTTSCKKCGSINLFTNENGTQVGLYCSDCGAWIKWLGKEEKRLAEQQIETNKNININNTPTNKDLRLLVKVADFVSKQEDYYYDIAHKELKENNIFGNQVAGAQASAFQRVRYYIQDLMESE
jgi:uncharacterized Zn finger protein (UPF0148 family)